MKSNKERLTKKFIVNLLQECEFYIGEELDAEGNWLCCGSNQLSVGKAQQILRAFLNPKKNKKFKQKLKECGKS